MTGKGKNIVFILVALIVMTFISMRPTLDNGFTNWDDSLHVTENKYIQQLSFENLKAIFTTYIAGNYYPVTMLSYAVEYHFSSLNPFVYHRDNLILHICNTLLVFWLIFLLTGNGLSSFIAALLFGIHPVHVEPAAWVSSRKDVLYCFFYLGSLISYIFYLTRRDGRRCLYFLTWLLFCLAFFSKPIAATFPILMLIFDLQYKRKWGRQILMEKIPFFAVTIILGLVAVYVQVVLGAEASSTEYNVFERFLFVCYGLIAPLIKFLWPIYLTNYYPYSPAGDGTLPFIYYISPLLLAGLALVVWKTQRWTHVVLQGMVFYLITIFCVLRFYPVGGFIVADRYAYLPYAGLCFIVGQGGSFLWFKLLKGNKQIKGLVVILFVAIIFSLSVLSWQRSHIWKDSITLWGNTIEQYPRLIMGIQSRANAYYDLGDYGRALNDYNRVFELNDSHEMAYNGRGKVYSRLGKYDLAIADFNRAILIKADYAKAYNNRAAQYYLMDQYELSLLDIKKALEIDPQLPQAYVNRGKIFLEQKKYEEALVNFEQALDLGLSSGEVYSGRGGVFLATLKLEQAIMDFTKVLFMDENDADAFYYRGTAYAIRGDYQQAINDFNKVIILNDEYLEAYYNRGSAYKRLGEFERAIKDYSRVLIVDDGYVQAYLKRAEVYVVQKKYDKAEADIRSIIRIDANHEEAKRLLQDIVSK